MKRYSMTMVMAVIVVLLLVCAAQAGGSRYYYSGTGAINITALPFSSSTVAVAKDAAGFEIRLHLGAAGAAGNLTVRIDSASNSKYDAALEVYDMSGVQDYVVSFSNWVAAGDSIVIAWANSGGATWGLELIWKD